MTLRLAGPFPLLVLVAAFALVACGDDDGTGNQNHNGNNTNDQPPVCGDGIQDTGESCDDGADNSDTVPDACRTTCRLPFCGDAVVDDGERCDDGNASDEDACLTTCEPNTCGDGHLDPTAEACDDGAVNSDSRSDACRTTCVLPACGDGVYDPGAGEECDDGALSEAGGCSNACLLQPGFLLSSDRAPLPGPAPEDLQTWGTSLGTHAVVFLSGSTAEPLLEISLLGTSGAVSVLDGPSHRAGAFALDGVPEGGFLLGTTPAVIDATLVLEALDASGLESGLTSSTLPSCGRLLDAAVLEDERVVLYRVRPSTAGHCGLESTELRVHGMVSGDDALLSGVLQTGHPARLERAGEGFAAIWREGGEVLGQRLDGGGTPVLGAPVQLSDVSLCADSVGRYALAALADGTGLLCYEARSELSGCEVRCRLLDGEGQPVGPSVSLPTTTEGELTVPDVTATVDGGFFVVWQRVQAETRELRGRFVDAAGAPVGADEKLGDFAEAPGRWQAFPRASASTRGVLTAWYSYQAGLGRDVILGTFLPRVVP